MPRAQVPSNPAQRIGTTADNLSKEVTGFSLCFAAENAKYTVDLSTGGTTHVKDFRMPSSIEIGMYEPYRFAARRRTTSNNEADIMIAVGISPTRA